MLSSYFESNCVYIFVGFLKSFTFKVLVFFNSSLWLRNFIKCVFWIYHPGLIPLHVCNIQSKFQHYLAPKYACMYYLQYMCPPQVQFYFLIFFMLKTSKSLSTLFKDLCSFSDISRPSTFRDLTAVKRTSLLHIAQWNNIN